MRIVLHDYSGHPFQVQLSRALAARGHQVLHLYSRDFDTPKGRLQAAPDDPPGLKVMGLSTGERLQKESLFKRRSQERVFGRRVADEILSYAPDAVISSNAPLDAQAEIAGGARVTKSAFVFWVQDLYGVAIERILRRRLGPVGVAVGAWYKGLERRLLCASDAVVAISDDFVPALLRGGVPPERLSVVENWAPLDEMPPTAAPEDRVTDSPPTFVYSGTLGHKHNPNLILNVAAELGHPVIVYSEGAAALELQRDAACRGIRNLEVRKWVAFDQLPSVLASADVLIAIIEPDAGVFCVPSKVLTYFCAGRPILAAIPSENLAARLIARKGAGLVSSPQTPDVLVANAKRLASDAELRKAMGRAARKYAEQAFDIRAITDRFDGILRKACAHRRAR